MRETPISKLFNFDLFDSTPAFTGTREECAQMLQNFGRGRVSLAERAKPLKDKLPNPARRRSSNESDSLSIARQADLAAEWIKRSKQKRIVLFSCGRGARDFAERLAVKLGKLAVPQVAGAKIAREALEAAGYDVEFIDPDEFTPGAYRAEIEAEIARY